MRRSCCCCGFLLSPFAERRVLLQQTTVFSGFSRFFNMTQQKTYTFRVSPNHREYKSRNILTLEDRVAVIREFEKNPVYQRLAEKYNCSSKQIKNIISSREEVLLYYNNRSADGSSSNERRQRQQKIAFLGKVIYEYIQRAVYHGIKINPAHVRRIALDVKESIAIMNFYPNNAWMQNFKTLYKVQEFDLMTLRQTMFLSEPKEDSFKVVDIIQYVSQREKLEQQMPPLTKISNRSNDHNESQVKADPATEQLQYRECGEPTISYEHDNDDFDYNESNEENKCGSVVVSLDSDEEDNVPLAKRIKSAATLAQTSAKPSLAPLPDIGSYQEALRHLKVLEDYAMLGDNYRAIGLITQLQQVLQEPPKGNDFLD